MQPRQYLSGPKGFNLKQYNLSVLLSEAIFGNACKMNQNKACLEYVIAGVFMLTVEMEPAYPPK